MATGAAKHRKGATRFRRIGTSLSRIRKILNPDANIGQIDGPLMRVIMLFLMKTFKIEFKQIIP